SVFSELIDRHVGLLLFQGQQNAVCHALHSMEARLCRRLLQASDTLDTRVLDVTQEFYSQMLGVQRTSVSLVAHGLQRVGCIQTRRGKIELKDRAQLESLACECYEIMKERTASVWAGRQNLNAYVAYDDVASQPAIFQQMQSAGPA